MIMVINVTVGVRLCPSSYSELSSSFRFYPELPILSFTSRPYLLKLYSSLFTSLSSRLSPSSVSFSSPQQSSISIHFLYPSLPSTVIYPPSHLPLLDLNTSCLFTSPTLSRNLSTSLASVLSILSSASYFLHGTFPLNCTKFYPSFT